MISNKPQKNFFQNSNLTSLPTTPPKISYEPEPQSPLNSSFEEESSFKTSISPDTSQSSFKILSTVNVTQSKSPFMNSDSGSLNNGDTKFFSLIENPYFGDEKNFKKNWVCFFKAKYSRLSANAMFLKEN